MQSLSRNFAGKYKWNRVKQVLDTRTLAIFEERELVGSKGYKQAIHHMTESSGSTNTSINELGSVQQGGVAVL